MKNNTSLLIILICLFIVLFSTTITLVNADDKMELQISLNVSFESQNVMKMARKNTKIIGLIMNN